MHITEAILLAAEAGAAALRDQAAALSKRPESLQSGAVGLALRTEAELKMQSADLLSGWAQRARIELTSPPR